jgi:hypothetical protein
MSQLQQQPGLVLPLPQQQQQQQQQQGLRMVLVMMLTAQLGQPAVASAVVQHS